MSKNGFSLGLALAFTSLASTAASYAPDGRSNAMGNIGVATADYLVAPLYNPALLAVFHKSDDIGILLPALGVNAKDADSSLETITDLQDDAENLNMGSSQSDLNKMNQYLDDLEGNKPVSITAGVAFAVAIPSNNVSVSIYGRGYVEAIANVGVAENTGDNYIDVEARYRNTNVIVTGFAYTEFGVALAKKYTIYGESFSFGVTPKYQILQTYSDISNVDDFDLELENADTEVTAFNVDLGAVWIKNNYRVALAVKDVLAQEIKSTTPGLYTYEMNPQATLGLAYAEEYFTFGVDVDLTEQTRYVELEDNTQFVRVGVEVNAWHWAQLRAGFEHDLQDTMEDSLTAGIGISPFGTLNLDVAGSYGSDNQVGASASLSFTF
ncbi:conjugal transfer protein TraF [Moritella sp.]|uniref:conjugal transfer protein TraF n=1 Tax=Moritella sp. TaxID=78556 RepID=UPI001D78C7B0|nr:conjugal transfer protein TraF [Moritella sp.]MCJ8348927.1 conjugal transfer protein TraF [Moritella sp.]NQZ38800.1 conjugal transfer protein TraF [Moritella sp.]